MEKLILLQKEIEELTKKKVEAVRALNFDKAKVLRDRELELKHELVKLQKEQEKTGEDG